MYIYNQWGNNKQLDYPFFMSRHITDTLPKIQKELLRFKIDTIRFYKVIIKWVRQKIEETNFKNCFSKI